MAADVSGLVANARERYRAVHATAVDSTAALLQAAAPRASGLTADSIEARPQVDSGTGYAAEVIAPTDQARYTNDGTPPHEIRPVRAQALRWESGGSVHFAKVVQHPGYVGTRWWDRTLETGWHASLQEAMA